MMKKTALLLLAAIVATVGVASASQTSIRNESGHCAWITSYSNTITNTHYVIDHAQWVKPGEGYDVHIRHFWKDIRVRALVMAGAACTGQGVDDTQTTWDEGLWLVVLKQGGGKFHFIRKPLYN